jgi:hypothetical protein
VISCRLSPPPTKLDQRKLDTCASLTALQGKKEGMKKSKFSEAQMATALRQVETGAPIPEVTRVLGISESTYYVWRR